MGVVVYLRLATLLVFYIHIHNILHMGFFKTQLKDRTERVTFVWWEDLTTGRVEWRYSGKEHGELSVTLSGLSVMPELFANSYNMLLEVVCVTMYNVVQCVTIDLY